mmetsp:Transcript_17017/g.18929  ORF Transcript_17017/g.18929 Transcript_17017/m.18929 type:complete len:412 (+) Transcript_17017:147-1382(+)
MLKCSRKSSITRSKMIRSKTLRDGKVFCLFLLLPMLLVIRPLFWAFSIITMKEESIGVSSNCAGTPKERRALASLGENTTTVATDWEFMTSCVRRRELRMEAHFGLHISKAGGTSLCDLFRSEKCSTSPSFSANCHLAMTAPQWMRKKKVLELNLPLWMAVSENSQPNTCESIALELEETNLTAVMNENWLPGGHVCEGKFMNTISVRNPMARILSHYNHVYELCLATRKNSCIQFLVDGSLQGDKRVFNVSFLENALDIISDNYYTRMLNNRTVYLSDSEFHGQRNSVLNKALDNLQKFDWVLLHGSGNNQENIDNNIIVKNGLGMRRGLRLSRSKNINTTTAVSSAHEEYLRDKNDLDNYIWQEAQRLHSLDIESIRLMKKYGGDFHKTPKKCCGKICPKWLLSVNETV